MDSFPAWLSVTNVLLLLVLLVAYRVLIWARKIAAAVVLIHDKNQAARSEDWLKFEKFREQTEVDFLEVQTSLTDLSRQLVSADRRAA